MSDKADVSYGFLRKLVLNQVINIDFDEMNAKADV